MIKKLIGIDASRATVARRTGTELYSLHLIQALLDLDTAHRWRLYFNQPPAPELFAAQLLAGRPFEQRVIPFPRLWTHLRLGLEVALRPPDVLFVPSHVLPRLTRPPAVVTVHDLGYLRFPEAHPPRQRRYLDWSTRHNARTARVVIADSQATKRDLVAHYRTPARKIVVAYPGPEPGLAPVRDPQALAAVKRRYGIRGAYFLHVGTLQPRKNLARLIQAFANVRTHAPASDVQLVLAGKKGWLYDDLFEQVRRLGLQERVLFPGYVEHKAALLSGALAYVLPSLYEGFGFPALEAQVCETPLVCANSTSLPEVAGDAALLVDPLDVDDLAAAMLRLLDDAELRAALVARGRRNCQRFTWRSCAQAVLQAIETIEHNEDQQ
jgi:glycosyltransferase involved in cell wall biosynthesis